MSLTELRPCRKDKTLQKKKKKEEVSIKYIIKESKTVSLVTVSDSLQPQGLWPTRLLCLWNSPGKRTGVGSHSLLQGIFPTQRLNPSLLHYRHILYHLSHQRIRNWCRLNQIREEFWKNSICVSFLGSYIRGKRQIYIFYCYLPRNIYLLMAHIKSLININEEGSQKKICQRREKYYFPDHGSSTRKQIHHQTNANIIFYKFTSFPGDLYLSLCQLFKESFRKI